MVILKCLKILFICDICADTLIKNVCLKMHKFSFTCDIGDNTFTENGHLIITNFHLLVIFVLIHLLQCSYENAKLFIYMRYL